jgi:DNA-binding transcriptional ArsR family regulator
LHGKPQPKVGEMTEDVRMAEIAALVGDPARANILSALMGGYALTAKELAGAARVSPQTTSGHLSKLAGANLIAGVRQGRHRYFRIATPQVAEMLEAIMVVVAAAPPRYRPPSKADDAMRMARTCYDHFAGKLGVGITGTLRVRGHIVLTDEAGEVTGSGSVFLRDFGIDVAAMRHRRRMFCRPCLDWTERCPHLGGTVGAALAQRFFNLRWVERMRGTRALVITPVGRRGLADTFGLSL